MTSNLNLYLIGCFLIISGKCTVCEALIGCLHPLAGNQQNADAAVLNQFVVTN